MRTLLIVILLLAGLQIPGYAQEIDREEGSQLVMQLLRDHSPDSYAIITRFLDPGEPLSGRIPGYSSSATDYMRYADLDSELDLVSSITTIMHEVNHGYTSKLPYYLLTRAELAEGKLGGYNTYFINSQKNIIVKETEVFPSREMHETIPERFQTFRFDTYIYPSSNITTQSSGVFGLLDEWNSYYHGARTAFELEPYYATLAAEDPYIWLAYLSDIASSYFAYLEFKYYILAYLDYAHRAHPKTYRELMQNKAFRLAYRAVDQQFGTLCDAFFAKIETLRTQLGEQGISTKIRESFFYIRGNGIGIFKDEWDSLTEALENPNYTNILSDLSRSL